MPAPSPAPASASVAASPAPPRPPSSPPSIETQARVELITMAAREFRSGTLASAAAAIAFAVVVSTEYSATRAWIWLGAMLVIAGFRLWLASTTPRAHATAAELQPWAGRCVIGTTATALGWGASVWLFPTLAGNTPLAFAHVLLLAGLMTGAARLLLPLRNGSIAYLLAIALPLAARFFANGDFTSLVLGGCVLIFIVYMAGATSRNHEMLSGALKVRLEREALNAELQAQHAQREGREAELREARQRAEEADRAKADFLATISHEIRTPMNGVLGMLRIVRETPLSPEQRDYLKTASDSAETLLLLLSDVLDFARIEAGKLELQAAPFPPAATARAVGEIMHTRARDKGLQFDVHVHDNVPGVIIGDAARLRQILIALVGNAIKFTERGHVDLSVTVAERAETRAVLHFTVADTGIGIDSSSLERLFKPFSQVDSSLGRRYGGTGLGLAISVRLAKAMGGLLQVQSTLNQGTTFRLILPCNLPAAVASPPVEEAPRFVAPPLQGRVLVVEDDSVNRQVMELFLKKMRLAPRFAHDGEAAIQIATTENFDVILMDCQLPGIDGMETTRRIRQELADARPPRIVALTANAGRDVRTACLAAGMDDFLTKPVRLELLVDVLQRNLPKG